MKLFEKYNRVSEHGNYHLGTFFSFGKLLRPTDIETTEVNEMGMQMTGITRKNIPEGHFVRVELPFTKTVTYTCPIDYEVKTGKCKPVWLWQTRTNRQGVKIKSKVFVWLPIEMT